MKTIYAVNAGDYSDYRVAALFTSREKAEAFMSIVTESDYNELEEFQLDPPTVDLLKRGYSVWAVNMLKDGTTEKVYRTGNDLYDVTGIGVYVRRPLRDVGFTPEILTGKVWAKTEEQAVKIVNEKRTQMIATGEWK